MALKQLFSQTNFTGGQVDADASRREDVKPVKYGARTMTNWRARSTGSLQVRPGRNAIALAAGPRSERFRMSPVQELIITFSTGTVSLSSSTGVAVSSNTSANYLWTNATVGQISWTVAPDRIVICFPGMRPQLILWDSTANTFSFEQFSFRTLNGAIQQPFFRQTDLGATMGYNRTKGTVTLTCSVPFFTDSMIGHVISIGGPQCTITAVGSTTPVTTATATVLFQLHQPHFYNLGSTGLGRSWSGNAFLVFPPHIIIQDSLSKAILEVTAVQSSTQIVAVQFTPSLVSDTDYLVSVFGVAQITSGGNAGMPQPLVTWQQEFMNATNGWPAACFYDHNRLGFCDFPQRPEAILWSAIGIYDIFYVDSAAAIGNPQAGTAATAAILEFIDGKPRVRNVQTWNGDTFVFTDRGIYVIPILAGGNPLKPGSVEFRLVTDASASGVRPALTQDALIFISRSGARVSAIVRSGNITTPYVEQDLTQFHSSLIKTPIWITVGLGDDGFPERYVYVLNSDGSVVVGKVEDDKTFIGWKPWTGAGAVSWISVFGLNVLFNTVYGTRQILEYEAVNYFLDHAINIATPPAAMLSGGNGAFIAFANGTVRVMDGAIDYGERPVSATGFLVKNPEDDFSSTTIVAGKSFTSTFTPFLEEAGAGPAQGQRQRRRKLARAIVSVYGSSGFTFGTRTIPPNNFGENPLAQPVLRETTYTVRFIGRNFDPKVTLTKDTPGPLTILELSQEVTN